MYSLEYETMIQVLRQLGYSGEFHADVSSQATLKEGGRVVLLVRSGNVISCFILNKNGQKVYHDAETLRLLPRLGILDWKLVSSTSAKSSTGPLRAKPVERNEPFIPRRFLVPETRIRSWSTLQRSVYFLVDGIRSTEQIAILLSRPLPTIEQVIHDFEAFGVITRS
jgi:hypothetical protein